jgi:polysaccharide export outer membrane protein
MRLLQAIAALVVGAAMLAGCASPPAAGGPATPAGDAAAPALAAEYRLGAGDELRVTVFDEPNMSGEFSVDGQGLVSLPFIGEIAANGLTLREFQRAVETALRDGILQEPRVSAEVINFRPFYILGEVVKPGEYPYTSGLTVFNAVARAEGFTYRADRRTVRIKSAGSDVEREVALTPSTPVQPGDTIRVSECFLVC